MTRNPISSDPTIRLAAVSAIFLEIPGRRINPSANQSSRVANRMAAKISGNTLAASQIP